MLTKKTTAILTLIAIGLIMPPPGAAWSWPVDGPVLRGFEFGGPVYHESGHSGIDIGSEAGSAVRTPAGGRVSFAGWLPGNGRTLTIRTSDGFAVTLLHLGTIAVSAEDGVAEGEVVGTIGPSGDAEFDVPYVHLGIRRADDPKGYVDPLTLLPPRPSPAPPAPAPTPPPAAVSPAPAPEVAPMPTAAERIADDRPPSSPVPPVATAAGPPPFKSTAAPRTPTRPRSRRPPEPQRARTASPASRSRRPLHAHAPAGRRGRRAEATRTPHPAR